MNHKKNIFAVKIIVFIFFSLFLGQILAANCRMGNASVPLNSVFYSAESDGCWTCMQYCCPNGQWSYEECAYTRDLGQFKIEDLCEDNMCDSSSLYWREKKACHTCDNGIPANGYAWGKREYDSENGYFLCDFKCEEGYEKIPRGTQDNGLMGWDGYCKGKDEGDIESGGEGVEKDKEEPEKTLRDDWTGFNYIYTGGICGNDYHALEICSYNAMAGKGIKACSGTPSCKGADGINYNCYANVSVYDWHDYCEGSWQWCAENGSNACRLNCEYVFYTCE